MSDTQQPSPTGKLSVRLDQLQRQYFVGRTAELQLFQHCLQQPGADFILLYLYGPGGIGKTTLLYEYARLARQKSKSCLYLDARNTDPTPAGFSQALRTALGQPPDLATNSLPEPFPHVLLLDTVEQLAPLENWLVHHFFPQLPEHVLIIMAGRNPPSPDWRASPGWHTLMQVRSLRNLSPEESRAYLHTRGIPEGQHPAILEFTFGHPFALSLVADVLSQSGEAPGTVLNKTPDIIRALLQKFLEDAPSAAHRKALEICAHVRSTTEDLLAEVLQDADTHQLFTWLRSLSFIEQGANGLFPHDLAREVLDADLRWRSPERYRMLHNAVRGYMVNRLAESSPAEAERAFIELLFMHRNSPFMKPYIEWKSLGGAYADPAQPEDYAAIREMVLRHEGAGSLRIADYWLERQPAAFTVFRSSNTATPGAREGSSGSSNTSLIGFLCSLVLDRQNEADISADPAVKAAWEFVQHNGPLRPGEEVLYHRFWMGSETYQVTSSAHNMVAITTTITWLTRPNLSWTFLYCANPDYWQETFRYLNMHRVPQADFLVEGSRYHAFTHDWRTETPMQWLDLMAERELAEHLPESSFAAKPANRLIVLSQEEFEETARQALRNFTRLEALAASPLVHSRLVTGMDVTQNPAQALQALLRAAVESLRANPRDEKFYRALVLTYLEPAPTQETAAERLGLPFSTYRYQLGKGIERVVQWLWIRELHASDRPG